MSKISNLFKKLSDSIFEDVEIEEVVEDSFEVTQNPAIVETQVKKEEVKKVYLDDENTKNNDEKIIMEERVEPKQSYAFEKINKADEIAKRVEGYSDKSKKFKHTKVISPVNGVLSESTQDLDESNTPVIKIKPKESKSKGVFKTVPSPIFGYNLPNNSENETVKVKDDTKKNKDSQFSLDDFLEVKEVKVQHKFEQVDADFESLAKTEQDTQEYENISLFDIKD